MMVRGCSMRKISVILLVFLALGSPLAASSTLFNTVKLLPGYHIKSEPGLDVVAWTIEKPGGLIVHFEAGLSEGLAVNPEDRDKYAWCRETTFNRQRVLLALTRPGVEIDPSLNKERNLPPGSVLLVSYPLGGHKGHAANFIGRVANSEEMLDMLLMVLTFDPSKGVF
jgi:hypothetical protein